MRHLTLTILALAACGTDGATSEPDAATSTRGFEIQSPDVTIEPGQEITYCYYFKTPNTEDMVIKKWSSSMTPGSHHMIMFTTTTDSMPPGTISDAECGGFSASNVPSWTYAAQTPENAIALPTDDGTGTPLGQEIPAGTSGYFQMHYLNASDEPLDGESGIWVKSQSTPPPTLAEMVFAGGFGLRIPGNGLTTNFTSGCTVPSNQSYTLFALWPHMHTLATNSKFVVKRGTDVTTLHDMPYSFNEQTYWKLSPEFQVQAGDKIEVTCSWVNPSGRPEVRFGDSTNQEMCFTGMYRYPAANNGLFQCTDTGGIGF